MTKTRIQGNMSFSSYGFDLFLGRLLSSRKVIMVGPVVNQPLAAQVGMPLSDGQRKDLGVLFDPSGLVNNQGKEKRVQQPLSQTVVENGIYHPTQPKNIHYVATSLSDDTLLHQEGQIVEQEEWDTLSDPERKIESYRDLIEQHLETRVQLAFMQMVSCYDVPLHFKAEGAEDQIGNGKNVKILNPSNPNESATIRTQGAHSSTFPCLYAYPRNPNGTYDATQKFVYLKYSGSYQDHNSTIMLPVEVNKTDTFMDGKSGGKRLRNYTLGRLNALSKKQTTVQEAMKGFVRKIIRETDENRIKPETYEKKAGVFQIYHDRAIEILEAMEEEGDAYFDTLLGVNLEDVEEEVALRSIVYRSRFEMIKSAQKTESAMMKQILDAENTIDGTQKKHLKGVDYRLKFALLKNASPDLKKTLERLFCCSIDQLRADIARKQTFRNYEVNTVDTYFETNKVAINALQRNLRKLARELTTEELIYRAKFFKDLRVNYKDWYLREFVAEYKELYPNLPMYVSKVSKMEQRARPPRNNFNYSTPVAQRRVDISIAEARRCAKTFDVEAGLFLPGVLTSNY